jgi:hypothetical protein
MTAKQTAGIAEALEKLGFKIIKIKDREGDVVFPATVEIKLTPNRHVKSKNRFDFKKSVRDGQN